ncbi:uncharacterized protein LOC144149207 isoform X2 [Haemaphysalis longicornis]
MDLSTGRTSTAGQLRPLAACKQRSCSEDKERARRTPSQWTRLLVGRRVCSGLVKKCCSAGATTTRFACWRKGVAEAVVSPLPFLLGPVLRMFAAVDGQIGPNVDVPDEKWTWLMRNTSYGDFCLDLATLQKRRYRMDGADLLQHGMGDREDSIFHQCGT